MLANHAPNEVEPNIDVAVDEAVAHAYDVAPRYIGMADFHVGRNLVGGLADHFKRANHGILVQTAGKEASLVKSFNEGPGISRRQ